MIDEALDLVLADDQLVFLDALSALLERLGHHVLAAATTCGGMMDGVRAFQPDVCVFENSLPDGDGVDAIGDMLSVSAATRMIVLTADRDAETMRRALDFGAAAYVHKTRGVSVLLDVLHRVMDGEIVIESSFARAVNDGRQVPAQVRALAAYLTPRELECLAMLAAGSDTTTMAGRLGVSSTTVRTHVQAVLTKLGVHSRLEAASMATRYGLVEFVEDEARATARTHT
jgi:two-component system, NarL family, nitrate/nitrite response regulator NarL